MAAVLAAALLAVSLAEAQPIPAPREGKPPEFPGSTERGPSVERHAPDRPEAEERPAGRPAQPVVSPEGKDDADSCAGDPERYQHRDLQAQQEMAVAAYWMTMATWVQVVIAGAATIVAGIGAYLVLRSLRYSRKQTKAATTAANAALEGNKLNREFFIAAQRAWLAPKSIKILSPLEWEGRAGQIDSVRVGFANIGKTPAMNVAINASIYVEIEWPNGMMEAYRELSVMTKRSVIAHRMITGVHAIFPDNFLSFDRTVFIQEDEVNAVIQKFADRPSQKVGIRPYLLTCADYGLAHSSERRQTGVIYAIRRKPGPDGAGATIGPDFGDVPAEMLYLVLWMTIAD